LPPDVIGQLLLLVDGGVDLGGDDALFRTGGEASHQNILLLVDSRLNLFTDIVFGALKVVPGLAVVIHEGEETIVHADQLVVFALHVGHLHVVGGGADVLKLFAGEDVESHHVNLGVTVFPGLGGGHLHDLAGPVLDHNETSFAKG